MPGGVDRTGYYPSDRAPRKTGFCCLSDHDTAQGSYGRHFNLGLWGDRLEVYIRSALGPP
jgi:hypothetical protein